MNEVYFVYSSQFGEIDSFIRAFSNLEAAKDYIDYLIDDEIQFRMKNGLCSKIKLTATASATIASKILKPGLNESKQPPPSFLRCPARK